MIAKWAGLCYICGKPITPGVDQYDYEKRKTYHASCRTPVQEEPDARTLADELGFVEHTEAAIRAAVPGWRVRSHWLLRSLLTPDRGDSAGRQKPETHRGQDQTLFGEVDDE